MLIEVSFILFLFYTNLLMGEFERSGMGQKNGLVWALSDIFTSSNFKIAIMGASERQTIAYKNALQEALCYGWIDSRVKSMDAEKFKVRFTPRKPGSPWSQRNLKLAQTLLLSGKMTEAGIAVLPSQLLQRKLGQRSMSEMGMLRQ